MKKDSSAPALTQYPLKVQAIRPKGARPKLYVYIPMPLAAAMGLNPGDTVQWELLDRDELHLIRLNPSPPLTAKRARRHK
jgi:plastocyanin